MKRMLLRTGVAALLLSAVMCASVPQSGRAASVSTIMPALSRSVPGFWCRPFGLGWGWRGGWGWGWGGWGVSRIGWGWGGLGWGGLGWGWGGGWGWPGWGWGGVWGGWGYGVGWPVAYPSVIYPSPVIYGAGCYSPWIVSNQVPAGVPLTSPSVIASAKLISTAWPPQGAMSRTELPLSLPRTDLIVAVPAGRVAPSPPPPMLMPEAHVVLAQREAAAVPVPVPPRPEEGFVVDRPIARAERVIRPAAFKAADPARLAQMIETGDRMFRVRNFVRAESWYQQALAADPESVRVRLRLAQLAVERGQYRQAANWLQEAQDIQPRWLDRADDVQVLYKEPVEFGRLIGRIETHLQAHPEDRDAWLLLGAQYQLAGRSKQASDIFLRLTDRRPDALLQAFLDTSAGVRR